VEPDVDGRLPGAARAGLNKELLASLEFGIREGRQAVL
jgi:hypothetical protein